MAENRIPFDIKYKKDILDGKYKLETRDGKPVIGFEYKPLECFPVRIKVDMIQELYLDANGKFWQNGSDYWCDLFLVPKVDLVSKLENYLATTPKEKLDEDWKKLEYLNDIGPTVEEYLYGIPREVSVSLEEEITKWECDGKSHFLREIAEHFFTMGMTVQKTITANHEEDQEG